MKTTTESLTRMNSFLSKEVEIKNEIMATDIYIKLVSNTKTDSELDIHIKNCLLLFRNFEKKYSRFIPNNFLDRFNKSTEGKLDKEFLDILTKAKIFQKETKGIFDIGVLPILKKEGYQISKNKGFYNNEEISDKYISSKLISIKGINYTKPEELKIDLGGIGKGYIVDKITQFLRNNSYDSFIVDAGGDIRFEGNNLIDDVNYWLCGISNPKKEGEDLLLVKLYNKAIATSGINKRNWKANNKVKNHLIDIKKYQSVNNDNLSCSVIADTVTKADVYAKSLLIMDLKTALGYADKKKIPVLFINKKGNIVYNNIFKDYIYEI